MKRKNWLWVFKKILCLITILCYHNFSNAQVNITKAEYFIDNDPGFGNAINISVTAATDIANKSFTVDLSNVANGFHNLFVRSQNANGKWSVTNATPFVKTASIALSNIVKAEYFIDTDPGFGNANNIAVSSGSNPPAKTFGTSNTNNVIDNSFTVDLSNVSVGFHNLFVRSQDATGKWSITNATPFVRTAGSTLSNIVKAEYFIDIDPGFGSANNIAIAAGTNISNSSFSIDLTNVSVGFHNLFVRSQDATGKWSITNATPFLKTDSTTLSNIVKAEYFIDTDPGFGSANNIVIAAGTNISNNSFSVDLTNVSVGFHNLFVRSQDATGKWSISNTTPFVKTASSTLSNIVKAEYFIDNDPGFGLGNVIAVTPSVNIANASFPVNVRLLPIGLHRLFIRSLNADGKWSITNVDTFRINTVINTNITLSNISSPVCAGETIQIPFTTAANFNVGNVFTAQLSDANGAFASSVNIGSATAVSSGIINAVIPANTSSSSNYKIRIVASNDADTSFDKTISINAIQPKPTVTISGNNNNTPVCSGCSVTITATTTNASNAVFSFFRNGVLKQTGASNTFQFAPTVQDTIVCVLNSTGTCNSDTITSNSYVVSIIKVPDLVVTSIAAQQTSIKPKEKINISWTVKNIGNLNTGDGWQERISLENSIGESVFIGGAFFNGTLDSGASVSRQIELQLPKILTLDGVAFIKIVLVPTGNNKEPISKQSNNTSVSTNSIAVGKQLLVESSKKVIDETDETVYNGYLFRSGSRNSNQTFLMRSSNTNRLNLVDTSVTINIGLSGAAFRYNVKDNSVVDADSLVFFTAIGTGNNYSSNIDTIKIIDNDLASLAMIFSKDSINEGDTIQLTLTRQIINNAPLTVSLSSSNDNRLSYQNTVTIPANQSSLTIPVIVNKSSKPALAENINFNGIANGYNAATDNVVIRASNIPIITLDVLPASFSEAAGTKAAIAKITRQGSTDLPITLTITDNSNGQIFYPSSSITLNKGESETQFFIGVVDNNLVDGSRNISLTASVFLSSCGCSVSSASNTISAGFVSKSITILDNDGPSLNISLSQTNLPEGKTNASVITVTRNTTTAVPLTINLSSDKDNQLAYTKTITIPIGNNKVDVPVTVLANPLTEGDRIVTFNANASGFVGSSTWAIITDRTLPDATISLLPLGFDSAFANATITVKSVITNEGVINIPVGTSVEFYISPNIIANASGQLLNTVSTTKAIAPGQKDTLITTIQLPNKLGRNSLVAQINPNQTFTELSYINNLSNSLSLVLLPNYKFINVASNKSIYKLGDSIIITGKAQAFTNVSVANVPVEVYAINNQFREAYTTTTDANGNFRFKLITLQGQLGHFSVGACYPNLGLTDEQVGFEILGLKLTNNDFIKWEVNLNDTLKGKIEIINPTQIALTKLKTTINSISNTGWVLKFDSLPNIAANGSVNLNYTITSNKPTATNNYEPINFTISSFEGASLNITSYFYCRALQANLQSSIATLQSTMIKGSTKLVSFVIKNIGSGATGDITVSLPNAAWLSLQTPATMPSLNNGDSQIVVLKLSPVASMPTNVPVVGTIAINCQQGSGIVLPFSITPVSSSKGTLVVDVKDEFTYFSASAPHVKDALVKVSDIYTNTLIAQGLTDSLGIFRVDSLPDGYYKLNVTALKHDSYSNNILINAGEINNVIVNLSFNAISYTWNVVPTTIKDEYNIVSTLTFVTNVPVPVVVLSMPDTIPALKGNDIFTFKAVLTNKGLITAKDVQFALPTDDQYEFIYSYTPTDILANQSIQIPVLVKVKSNATSRKTTEATNLKCADFVLYIWGWECGADKKFKRVEGKITFSGRNCSGQPLTPTVSNVGIGIVVGFPSGGLGVSHQPIIKTEFPYTQSNNDCDPCTKAIGEAAAGCVTGNIANALGCLNSLTDLKLTKKEAITCIIGFLPGTTPINCALGLLDAYCVCNPGGFCNKLNDFNGGGGINSPIFDLTSTSKTSTFLPSSTLQSNVDKLARAYVGGRSMEFWANEIFKGIEKKQNAVNFYEKIEPFITNTFKISDSLKLKVKNEMANTDVSATDIDNFVQRWNNTMDAWSIGIYSPNSFHPDIIDTVRLHYYDSVYSYCFQYAHTNNFSSIETMLNTSLSNIKEITNQHRSSVCAAVTIQFSQTVTMTRQAFRGTFSLFNGNTTDSIKNFKLNLVIKDDQGNIAGSSKFQINTESISKLGAINGTGTLSPNDTGSATILFIPTKNAAPTVPKQYSFGGTISYLDPFTGTVVTRDLFPVTITVNPSPDLVLDYFIQRDILGDDPLTAAVEPSVPAEFSMIISNQGFGDATQVQFTTDEPKIVDNQKGLLLDLKLTGSSLNGAPTSIGFNNLDFGTINARSTMYGQWFFTSSLLGQFVNYDVKVTHVSSYNNPDLSLISAANIHQLVHTINVPSNSSSNPLGFLSTDVPNLANNPDMIYVTDGTKQTTFVAQNANVIVINDSTLKLTVTPSIKGWNYKSLINPFATNKTLKNVVKESSNINVSLRNVWLTDRTMFEGQDPIYENRIHIADDIQDSIQSYILTFNAEPSKRLTVDAIAGVPDTVSSIAVKKLTVRFNKAINAASFTGADVTLRCQGVILNTSNLLIAKINDSTYELNFAALTDSNGFYSLTVQTAAIVDKEGFAGIAGFVVGWNQFTNNSLQIVTVANPSVGGTITPSSSSYPFGTSIKLVAKPALGFTFKSWTIDNADVAFDTALNHLVTSSKIITANFDKKKCLLNVVSDVEKGIVSGNQNGIYEFNDNINLSIVTNAGYSFLGWKVNDVITSTNTSFSIVITKDLKIEPTFKTKTTPVITWNTSSILTCTKVLDASILNASSTVAGSFVYTPPLGTALLNDSVYTLKVKFTPTDIFNFNVVSDSISIATDFVIPVTNNATITGCDSVLFKGKVFKTNTTLRDTIKANQGCDSVYNVVNILIKRSTTKTIDSTICSGQLPFNWNGLTFNNAGTQTAHLTNAVSCDSAVTLNLSIKTNFTITASAGSNGSISPNGTRNVCSGGNLTYIISASSGYHIADVLVDGSSVGAVASFTFTNITINHTIVASFAANCVATSSVTNVNICDNQLPYNFNGQSYTIAGTYVVHITNSCGGDSAATLNLTIIPSSITSATIHVCSNQLPYLWNGLTFNSSGTQTATLTSVFGCDSVVNLTVLVGTEVTPTLNISTAKDTVCNSGTITFTATASNGGSAPVYQWKKNGNNIGTGFILSVAAITLVSGDKISCVLTANNACQTTATANSNVITMFIKPIPNVTSIKSDAGVIAASYSHCSLGVGSRYFNTTQGGVWSSSNNSVVSIDANGITTNNTNGSANINYTVTVNGCSKTVSTIINVAAVSINNITGSATACVGVNTQYNNTTPSGVWSVPNRGTISNTGLFTPTAAGSTYIYYKVTNAFGCSNTASKIVAINSLPVVNIGYAAGSANPGAGAGGFCANRTVQLVGTTTATGGSGVWSKVGTITVSTTGLLSTGSVASIGNSVTFTYTDGQGCAGSKTIAGNIVICASRGVQQSVVNSQWSLYPNPSTGVFNIKVEKFKAGDKILITDIYGKQVYEQNINSQLITLNSQLSKGMYLVSVITEGGKETRKVIIE